MSPTYFRSTYEGLFVLRLGSSPEGTKGLFFYKGTFLTVSLEEVDCGNIPNRSCIPAGEYPIRILSRLGRKDRIAIDNVPGRTDVEIHVLNNLDDTEGCIGPGRKFGMVYEKPGILKSNEAMDVILTVVKTHKLDKILIEWLE